MRTKLKTVAAPEPEISTDLDLSCFIKDEKDLEGDKQAALLASIQEKDALIDKFTAELDSLKKNLLFFKPK